MALIQNWGVQTGGLKTLIFDFDGTIADTMQHVFVVYNEVADRYGVPEIAAEEIPRLRSLGPKQAMIEYGVPFWKVPLVVQAVVSGLRERIESLQPFDKMVEALSQLQRSEAHCYLVSSNSTENIAAFLRQHRIEVFEQLVCGATLFGKAARLRKLLAHEKLCKETTAYIGDEVRDIEAARSAGLRSIAVSWGYSDRAALVRAQPDQLFDTPDELLAFCLDAVAKS